MGVKELKRREEMQTQIEEMQIEEMQIEGAEASTGRDRARRKLGAGMGLEAPRSWGQ